MDEDVGHTWDGVQGSTVIVVGQECHRFCLGPLRLKHKPPVTKNTAKSILKSQEKICEILTRQEQAKTHDMRTVSGVNQDLVVGVGFPLHLLRAVSSGRLALATGRKTFHCYTIRTKNECL